LISKSSNKIKFLIFFGKLKTKHFLVGYILFGSLLSCFKLFQYKLNELHLPYSSFPLEIFDVKYCSITFHVMCKIFSTLKLFETIVNDVLIFILNLIIDICLYFTYKKEIEHKKTHSSLNPEELDKKQKDVCKMIILNGVLYFVSHFPEFLTTLLLNLFPNTRIYNFCTFKFECDIINENVEAFSLISISCQFYVFLRFNCLFNNSFKERKNKFIKHFRNFVLPKK